ncbi:MAG: glycosyltransferase [Oligoflexia bacterium]|nr:glycosyltransferase [Oligoflexia bacterium]
MKTSLSISTYKSYDFLNKVLESVKRQSIMPNEVIVTEDGQSEDNKVLLAKWKEKLPVPLIHITQKDIGNRKPLALNKAILKASGDYIVFIDGDCVLRDDFIKDHIKNASEDCFLAGRRVELSEKASLHLTAEKIAHGYLNGIPWFLILDALLGKTHHIGRFFKTPEFLKKLFKRNDVFDIRGCNFSVHKKHLVAINGFSNDFSGAYGEDSDVEYRLKFLGLKMKSLRGSAIQYHLWHKTQAKDQSNQKLLEELLQSRKSWAANGLSESSSIA